MTPQTVYLVCRINKCTPALRFRGYLTNSRYRRSWKRGAGCIFIYPTYQVSGFPGPSLHPWGARNSNPPPHSPEFMGGDLPTRPRPHTGPTLSPDWLRRCRAMRTVFTRPILTRQPADTTTYTCRGFVSINLLSQVLVRTERHADLPCNPQCRQTMELGKLTETVAKVPRV